jgi:hypothetical protein
VNERLLPAEELAQSFASAGFDNIEVKGLSGISFKYVASSAVGRLLRLYNLADLCLEKSGLGKRWGAFLISSGIKPR